MIRFIVYKNTKILRTGHCPASMIAAQAGIGESVIEGTANDIRQKIIDDRVVNKSQAEIDAETPAPIPDEDRSASITKKQWQAIQDRVAALEKA